MNNAVASSDNMGPTGWVLFLGGALMMGLPAVDLYFGWDFLQVRLVEWCLMAVAGFAFWVLAANCFIAAWEDKRRLEEKPR